MLCPAVAAVVVKVELAMSAVLKVALNTCGVVEAPTVNVGGVVIVPSAVKEAFEPEPPVGAAHVPSPRQNVEEEALVPPLRLPTGRLPVTSAERLTEPMDIATTLLVFTRCITPVPAAVGTVNW